MRIEPIEVSPRFRAAVVRAISRLERDAAEDERRLAKLAHGGHRRRQRMLVESQMNRAFRLHELLATLAVREREPMPALRRI